VSHQSFEFATDTATLVVFDLGALKHRRSDAADWWCWPAEEQVRELNAGNAAFIDLGSDGKYHGTVFLETLARPKLRVHLACPTGTFFVGAGEEATCEGGEPECVRGGVFVSATVGSVTLQVGRGGGGQIELAFLPHAGVASNQFQAPLALT
jgi:hypothetical protein